jgi:hypothetical protein
MAAAEGEHDSVGWTCSNDSVGWTCSNEKSVRTSGIFVTVRTECRWKTMTDRTAVTEWTSGNAYSSRERCSGSVVLGYW